ncbi:hypothetical protein [Roseisolibacter agri]|uniref:Uncharacterized protein n=1 Tax=Roseisolibacter agri TaxID=2014610 RepID=A0AA37V308_9BACT|nr:hypothetical protein [Roseisolibacter agri]GLC25932.1 hypothetical protein rosag_24450 [Roseisolibacter agri]
MPDPDAPLPPSTPHLVARGVQLLLAAGALAFVASLLLGYARDDRPGVPTVVVVPVMFVVIAVLRLVGEAGGGRRAATVVQWLLAGLTVLYLLLAAPGD